MKILINLYLPLIWILFVNTSYSQNDRFNVGVIGGMNFSELEGDELTDYFGLNTGLIGTMRLSAKNQIGIEFLFSQNAEYIIPKYYPNIEYGQIRLNHLEIPIHFDWLIRNTKRNKIYNINIQVGIAYVKIIGHSAKDLNQVDVSSQIVFDKKDAFHLQSGLTYKITKNIGLNFKATIPIKVEDWTIAARMIYMIN